MATANSIPDPTLVKPSQRRRWIPLSLRMFLVILLTLGAGSALWIGVPACRQWMAIRAIEQRGGTIETVPKGSRWLPGWARHPELRIFDRVHAVKLGEHASYSTLSEIGVLTDVRTLWLEGAPVTDAGLEHLKGLAVLSDLRLGKTPVTDAGLAHLKPLTRLSFLSLHFTRVTDAGLIHLEGLTNLRHLLLSTTLVTDAGFTHLNGLSKLESLYLENTKVTDAGLIHLQGLKNLTLLSLDNTRVTDAGLEHLEGLTKLTTLHLLNTQATDAGVAKLKRALPKLTVITQLPSVNRRAAP
jgi:hypothetical protein